MIAHAMISTRRHDAGLASRCRSGLLSVDRTTSAGSQYGENMPAEEFRRLIREVGRVPVERNTTYGTVRRFDDPALDPPSLEPGKRVELSGPRRQRGATAAPRVAAQSSY